MTRALSVAACSVVVVLGGCAGGSNAPNAGDKMLVLGAASGELYTKLKARYREVRPTGQPSDLSGFRLVVVDGDTISPEDLARHSAIRRALTTGVPLLFLHASEPHKRSLLGAKLLPFSVKGQSDGYLVTTDGPGRYRVRNLRPLALDIRKRNAELDDHGVLTGSHEQKSARVPVSSERVDQFLDFIQLDRGRQVAPPTPPSDYPQSSWFTVSVSDDFSGTNPDFYNDLFEASLTYTFSAYYDSGSTLPSKYFQWVACSVEGTVTPQPPGTDEVDARGFAMTMNECSISPNNGPGNGLQLSLVEVQPTNESNNLSSELLFDIGYKGDGNTAWTWTQQQSQSVGGFGGWEASSAPSNQVNAANLQYMQTSPYNGDGSNWQDAFYKVFVGKHIHPMNTNSTQAMGLVGNALWRTQAVFDGTVTIDIQTAVTCILLTVSNYFVTSRTAHQVVATAQSTSIDLDLGALQIP
ncbi:MAG TPA: hypothetical protein PLH94_02910 [Fimbriimonadaceae bacterium]|nr:hypothetical protein [Fimbriimonadaceae bacterium]